VVAGEIARDKGACGGTGTRRGDRAVHVHVCTHNATLALSGAC
jgi:hypothetical protein